ncbi:hypothetical protein [cf. Phormidesmis sp. LEGE 11477]|uniref:hypothetical protein n=1 Tax=cf. Phormidesmis sp. LEGE 11477 TaxID=1828680 RepID=UPI0018817C3A|nr:hypothetical protein [cf. Phormidesmis sp. LEGE 11477]MBE9062879.1 hypothetical protein [cf. Phormidesmis sp. LEGE 11477]
MFVSTLLVAISIGSVVSRTVEADGDRLSPRAVVIAEEVLTYNKIEGSDRLQLAQNFVVPPCESLQNMIDRGVNVELDAEVDSYGELFQMWSYVGPETRVPETIVTKVMVSGLCGLAFTPYDEYITNRIPLDIARELTLQSYYPLIEEAGGIEQYREQITSVFSGTYVAERSHGSYTDTERPPIEINSVDKWAFDQLGIVLPEGSFVVLNIDDEWEYDYEYNYDKN